MCKATLLFSCWQAGHSPAAIRGATPPHLTSKGNTRLAGCGRSSHAGISQWAGQHRFYCCAKHEYAARHVRKQTTSQLWIAKQHGVLASKAGRCPAAVSEATSLAAPCIGEQVGLQLQFAKQRCSAHIIWRVARPSYDVQSHNAVLITEGRSQPSAFFRGDGAVPIIGDKSASFT